MFKRRLISSKRLSVIRNICLAEYLSKQLGLYRRLKGGHGEKIAFKDLWMLYDTDDTIYCPSQEDGLEIRNAWTRTCLIDRSSDWLLRDLLDNNGFRQLSKPKPDFDGVKYGTVIEVFVFKPYDGEVDIKSLEAYPLQYLKATSTQPSEANASETTVSHMVYDGLTVGTVREEINGEIMVDFRMAFEEYHESFQDPKPAVPQFTSLTAFWPDIDARQFYEYYSCGDNIWCEPSCISEFYSTYQKRQREQREPKVKILIEESEYEKVYDKEAMELLKDYMEGDDLLQHLPGVVPCYALRNRKWVQLDLSLLEYVKQQDEWNHLVLPNGHREMAQAMVETHAKVSRLSMDNREDTKMEMELVHGKVYSI
ncbi:hypothetical protein BO78DRAFT_424299 [Aspergillus sclerotiicarbonarius CBS 121057]|uniref:DUF7025 domain-containing protein n=1 Tax=Aspergillus sclerotiicarbonarius (strain CBS 121057 / IBT 28362) TaxID=1448318 RepID=A0A319DSP6_ASPSB|nr:hypothetical protein BO78DRAFT_424299 [Aspergillus sclerotiicarbonarius CBS 121057]